MVLFSGKGMKMKVQKYEIARVIDKLKSIVQKNDQFPALGGILVKDGYLIASNSEITMKVKLEASEGSYFIIPMKAFDLIKNLPDGEIDISATDKNVVMIKIGAIKNKYQSYPPEEFNFDITEDPEADGVELNGKKIMEANYHGHCKIVRNRRGQNLMATVGDIVKEFKKIYREYSKYEGKVYVQIDDTGLGGGVTDRLKEVRKEQKLYKMQIIPINAAEKIETDTAAGKDAAEKYNNLTTAMWASMRDLLDNKQIVIEDDEQTVGQLSSRKYTMTSNGMLFRTESVKDNPEGRSILRNAYRSWYFKRRIQEIEAIGIERDLAGLPVIHAPERVEIWDQDPDMVKINGALITMVKNLRRNESEGLVLPHGYEAELLSTGGTRQFDTNAIINRYDTKIAQTVLADFIMLGHEKTGSFALSSDKTELFSVALGAFLDIICETFNNQGIPSLIDINGSHFDGIEDYPTLAHGDVDKRDITKLSTFLKDMVGTGILIPDEELEDYVREAANLPERTEVPDSREKDERREAQRRAPEKTANEPDGPEVDPEENQDAEEAKKRLGR